MLAEDANFKQKARLRPKSSKDPPLGPGWATFVQNDAYLEHLVKFVDQDEVSKLSIILIKGWNLS